MAEAKVETGLKDCENKNVRVGDLVECSAPIFTKPKRFIVEWDSVLGRYNYPTSLDLTSHCRVIDHEEKH